jgi:glycosyltransferase involved in cell wall biosynthesis
MKTILYLHDYEGWAFDNVGKLWLSQIVQGNLKITFKRHQDTSPGEMLNYDFVWFNCLFMYELFCYELKRSIIAIHDPWELFPPIKDWKMREMRNGVLPILRKAKSIIVISQEMQSVLRKYGINAYTIPTTSLLPLRTRKNLITKKCSLLSVFNSSPRKNPELILSLHDYCRDQLHIAFDLKVGHKILPEENYIELLDEHEVYVCTSFQEGGPLAAMDAMRRGAVVISTPVGQIQEMILDGENGFICETREAFVEKIILLSDNLDLLHRMRLASLDAIFQNRDRKVIEQKVSMFLNALIWPGYFERLICRVKYRLRQSKYARLVRFFVSLLKRMLEAK